MPLLPPAQLSPLAHAYDAAVAAKRRWTMLGLALVVVFSVLSAWIGEVDLAKFWNGLPRFVSYFHDILPQLRAESLGADLEEWFWNLDGWLALLLDTLLVAYVGVLKHMSETSEKKPGMITSEGLAEGSQEYQRRGEFA